jgi:hypothetical protein
VLATTSLCPDTADGLSELRSLRAQGVITEAEFTPQQVGG